MKSTTQNEKITAITEKTLIIGIDVLLFTDFSHEYHLLHAPYAKKFGTIPSSLACNGFQQFDCSGSFFPRAIELRPFCFTSIYFV